MYFCKILIFHFTKIHEKLLSLITHVDKKRALMISSFIFIILFRNHYHTDLKNNEEGTEENTQAFNSVSLRLCKLCKRL